MGHSRTFYVAHCLLIPRSASAIIRLGLSIGLLYVALNILLNIVASVGTHIQPKIDKNEELLRRECCVQSFIVANVNESYVIVVESICD